MLTDFASGGRCRLIKTSARKNQQAPLGWAYNATLSEPSREPKLDANFPEIVLRAASRMLPRLKLYGSALPRERSHYGGFYTMTEEN